MDEKKVITEEPFECKGASTVFLQVFYGDGSLVSGKLIGKECSNLVTDMEDLFGIMGFIMTQLSQHHDIKIQVYDE